jgi:hypothetical protein
MGFDTGNGDIWLMMEITRTQALIDRLKKMRDDLN